MSIYRILPNLIKCAGRSITPVLEKGAVAKGASLFKTSEKLVVDTFEKSGAKISDAMRYVKGGVKDALDKYNLEKLAKTKRFGSTETVLNNWQDKFGIAEGGVYQNAIKYLKDKGAIDKFIVERCPQLKDSPDFATAKRLLTQYLEKNLDIYSYPRIEGILRKFDSSITKKLSEGAVIYIPDDKKSYNIITELYKAVNPKVKVINGYGELQKLSASSKDLKLIILDDCLVSGESAQGIYKSITDACGKNLKELDMYFLTGYKEGLKNIPSKITTHVDGDLRQFLRFSDYFKGLKNNEKGLLMQLLASGHPKYNIYGAIMFPYMAPNNNSLFSAHMIRELFSGPEIAIKGITTDVQAGESIANGIISNLIKNRASA